LIDLTKFTPGEQAILRLLADGVFHTAEDIGIRCSCSPNYNTMSAKIWYLKQKLKTHGNGLDIEKRLDNFIAHYRLVKPVQIDDTFFRFCPRVNRD